MSYRIHNPLPATMKLRKITKQNPRLRDLPTFSHGVFGAQKLRVTEECGGAERQVSALRGLTLAPIKEAPREKNSRGAYRAYGARPPRSRHS